MLAGLDPERNIEIELAAICGSENLHAVEGLKAQDTVQDARDARSTTQHLSKTNALLDKACASAAGRATKVQADPGPIGQGQFDRLDQRCESIAHDQRLEDAVA